MAFLRRLTRSRPGAYVRPHEQAKPPPPEGKLKSTSLPTASKVTRAQQRLDKAIERLERAVAARPDALPSAEDVEALARLKAENESLKTANERVSVRLDETIGRLKRLLDA